MSILNVVDCWVLFYMFFGIVGLFAALVCWLIEHK